MSSDFKNYLNCYEFTTKLPGNGQELKIKPITTRQLKRVLLYESVEDVGKIEEVLDSLITESVASEDFDVNSLYLQDRFFLILELRKITKGNLYMFQANCQKCGSQSMQKVDLTALPVKTLQAQKKPTDMGEKQLVKTTVTKKGRKTEEQEPETKNEWNVIKINDNISVEVSYITRGMQVDAFNFVNNIQGLNETQKRIEALTVTQAMAIKSITTPKKKHSDINLEDRLYLLDNITQAESDKIVAWFEENDFGVDFKFTQECPFCKEKARREIPLEDFFF